MEEGADAKTVKTVVQLDGGNEYGISQKQYAINLTLMVLLFTCFSFMFWLVDFQQEYLGTDMYILFYANGVVCIVSGFFNMWLYPILGMKMLIIWTDSVGLLATLFLILV
jgi:hypothetical protein